MKATIIKAKDFKMGIHRLVERFQDGTSVAVLPDQVNHGAGWTYLSFPDRHNAWVGFEDEQEIEVQHRGILWGVLPQSFSEKFEFYRLHQCGAPHHITLFYDCAREEVEQFVGQIGFALFDRIVSNEFVQCAPITFEVPEGMPPEVFARPHPHITFSWAKDGGAPVLSNGLLALGEGDVLKLDRPVRVAFEIQFKPFEERS